MPIISNKELPAYKRLHYENDIKPDLNKSIIKLCIINIMPDKMEAEKHLLRLLSNSPLQIDITLCTFKSHKSTHVTKEHLDKFYLDFEEVRHKKFDGCIFTGAPVETTPEDSIDYITQLKEAIDWSQTNSKANLFICFSAMFSTKYLYNISYESNNRIQGVYKHVKFQEDQLSNNMPDLVEFCISRRASVQGIPDGAKVLFNAETPYGSQPAIYIKDKNVFCTSHPEYSSSTLQKEYDVYKITEGVRYPDNYEGTNTWESYSVVFIQNWINYMIYQR